MVVRALQKKDDKLFSLRCRGYFCPQLYTKKALDRMREGAVLEVIFDGPCAAEAIEGMCEMEGHQIIESVLEEGTYRWKIRKAA
jgi:TusA-related sulfurtransferase